MVFMVRVSEKSLRASRARWLIAISVVSLAACFLRLVHLQLIRGRALEVASENNHTQILVEHAPRGRILDRHGKILADNRDSLTRLAEALLEHESLSGEQIDKVMRGEKVEPVVLKGEDSILQGAKA